MSGRLAELNAPYAFPKAGHAAILAGDARLAREILERLAAGHAGGSRGDPTDAAKAQAAASSSST